MKYDKNATRDPFNYLPSSYDGQRRGFGADRRHLRLRRATGNRDTEIDRWINEGGALTPSEMHRSRKRNYCATPTTDV
jgi:hypothetical protein